MSANPQPCSPSLPPPEDTLTLGVTPELMKRSLIYCPSFLRLCQWQNLFCLQFNFRSVGVERLSLAVSSFLTHAPSLCRAALPPWRLTHSIIGSWKKFARATPSHCRR